jgi:GDPmannose 4,6-dehydratase
MAFEAGITGGPYNICNGASLSMQDVLDRLLGHYRGNHTVSVVTDPDRLRPVDTPDIRGDAALFSQATGWEPETPFSRTLADLLDHERERSRTDHDGGGQRGGTRWTTTRRG